MKRKLTTIFCADAAGYGAHMSADEDGTIARLQRFREIMDQLFDRHHGRKVNTWGDAVIAEFASVVEAVRCAVEVQTALNAENDELSDNQKMLFRIGINMGDVMEDNGDIYGDGVNIAARLESMAEPGGIMVSESVYDFTHKQLAFGYEYMGEKASKNGEDPIPSYKVRLGGRNAPDDLDEVEQSNVAAAAALAGNGGSAAKPSLGSRIARWVDDFPVWFMRQPKRVKASVMLIAFFFTINLLFSGIATPWFIFPSMPLALVILFSKRDGTGSDRDDPA